ncbi:N-acetylneuraminate lyase [Pedobacter sp. Bi27]|uniref:dihydrodipicolinate synthase family protein n=1 Tax=unclassified Pedobacter TaxID=2628915 RepID=UPI001DB9903D|nr:MULTISPECIES: dihydrodipicolinate synthase family protein [unclassified Pedobacter]CAH0128344.1 N-acetylneuraminate lyase [Pedobacter sp. Bi36]CAH0183190.1 N-acetylneuraminate lyase [Pedobacter sp. Bi126]CAH0275169.1 N-acetylneuraminate lyase [Pedobacter sp. Bi27]
MKINGIVAATFAAYQADGSLNLTIIPQLVDKLVADGVAGVYICGTNGEGPNMTVEERMAIAEAYVKAANKRILVLVHVGHTSIHECKKLAAHAAQIGADAFSSVAAFYFKPTSVQNLVDCMAEIASAAPELPFYYYHMPTLTGVGMDMVEFLALGEQKIPNLAGIKYTASTLHEFQACLNYKDGKFEVLSGYDEMLLSALAVGAVGAIGSTYTFAAPVYLEIIKLFRNNDLTAARALQLKVVDFIRCIIKHPSIAAQRAIMKMLGYDLGDARLPLVPLSSDKFIELKADLTKTGFFELLEKYR